MSIRPLLELQALMNEGKIEMMHGATLFGMVIMFIPDILRGNLYEIGVSKNWIGLEVLISNHAGAGGLGYSLQAESYSNFGNFGWVMFLLWGAIITKCLTLNNRRSYSYNYVKKALLPGLFSALVIITRESSLLLLKYLLVYIFAPYILVRIFSSYGFKNKTNAVLRC